MARTYNDVNALCARCMMQDLPDMIKYIGGIAPQLFGPAGAAIGIAAGAGMSDGNDHEPGWGDSRYDERNRPQYDNDALDPWRVRKYPHKYGAITLAPGTPVTIASVGQSDLVHRFENFSGSGIVILAVKQEYLGVDPTKCIVLNPEDIVVRTVKRMTSIYALVPNSTPGVIKVEARPVDPQNPHPLFVGLEVEPPGHQKGRREWKEPNE